MSKSLSFLFTTVLLLAAWPAARGQDTQAGEFWEACRNGNLEIITAMLDSGADPNIIFEGGVTPLTAAAMRGQLGAVKLLAERGADLSKRDNTYKLTPLGMAALFGQQEILQFLLPRATADMDLILRMGASQGVVPLVEAALKATLSEEHLSLAWSQAKAGNHEEVLELLGKAGVQPPPSLSAEDLKRFAGLYQDETAMELEVGFQDGKLIGTGGDGFFEFFEQELVPFGGGRFWVKGAFFTTVHFKESSERPSHVALRVPGESFNLQRVEGDN